MKAILTYILLFVSVLSFAQTAGTDPFVCPPCDNDCDKLTFAKAGTCPHCGMELIQKSKLPKKKMRDYFLNCVK